jgi:outer membrane protein
MKKLIPILVVLISLPDLGFLASAQTPEPKPYEGTGLFSGVKSKYVPRPSPAVNFTDSPRLEKLLRAGRIYLSLQDAVALALENNLDIEFARYGMPLADTDVLRARAGQLLRNVSSSVRSGPSSASGALAGVQGVNSSGQNASSSSSGGILSGVSVQLAGSAIPNLDPTAYFQGQFGHQTQILTNSTATGVNYLVSGYQYGTFGFNKGFLTGTSVQLSNTTQRLAQNSPLNDFSPATTGNVALSVTQHLLQGFGPSLNGRVIQIARNNRHAADITFRQQVIATVSSVADLYWDLVSFNDNLKVRQQSLELNQKLYTDNKRRAELGAIAPIDIVQAEAEMEASQQEVTNAETQVLQQEMILKNVLMRNAMDNLEIATARLVPTDPIRIPDQEPAIPIQDLVSEALANRPEVEQSRISLENSRLSMKGTRNALQPTLDIYASAQNNGLAGQMNTLASGSLTPAQQTALLAQRAAGLNAALVGGYGGLLGQLFRRNFPDYSIGFNFSVSLSNRSAQADFIKDQLNYRQQQINDHQTNNNIKLNVINARTALLQARAAYETSVKARKLQEQTLAGERRKFQLGTSSFLNVVIVQRDTVTREAAEVQALNTYIRARSSLVDVLGRTLKESNVSMDEALTGQVKREAEIVIPQR